MTEQPETDGTPQDGAPQDGAPKTAADLWARRRGRNIALFSAIIALSVLFFVITIVRMS